MYLKNLHQILIQEIHTVRQQILKLDLQAIGRQSGLLRRTPRKIGLADFLLGLLAAATEPALTLERVASLVGLSAQCSYSKQALHKRLNERIENFLAQTATALFGQLPQARDLLQGLFAAFRRVLLHDSTIQTVPKHLAKAFPGSRNQRAQFAAVKIQFISDLLSTRVLHFSLSGFQRNDQAAASDILLLAQPGDLVIRDLGYFLLRAFQWLQELGAFFLSRCRPDLSFYDARTGAALDLVQELRRCGQLDRQVLVGAQKLAVRLVAIPVPEEVANERRRKAKAQDRRSRPSAKRLFLMSWSLLLTNVPKSLWPAKVLPVIYRLRWRIEMIFKAWKSHLGLRELNCRTANLLRLSVMSRLLFCVLVYRFCQALELCGRRQRHVSLQRLARVIRACACEIEGIILATTAQGICEHSLSHHAFYEVRNDRKNFYELLAAVCAK